MAPPECGHSSSGGRRGALAVVEPDMALFRYLEVAHAMGLETVVLASYPEGCIAGERDYSNSFVVDGPTHIDRLLPCATGDPGAVTSALRQCGVAVAGIIAGDDHLVPVVAAAGRALQFDYALPDDALTQQRKSDMKVRFAAEGVPTPAFVIARDLAAAELAWYRFGGDCVVKMVDYQGSMNVSRAKSLAELQAAWTAIRDNRYQVNLPMPRAEEVLLEEYVSGRELSAEGYVAGDQIVILNYCEKLTAPNFVVIGHYLPAALAADEIATLEPVVIGCVRALGIRNTVFHIELHLRDGQAYVIEAAARPPGQHMVELMVRSYGWDLMAIGVQLAVGASVHVGPVPPRTHYAMLAFWSECTGTLRQLQGLEALGARQDVLRLKFDLKPGDPVRSLDTFRDRYGFVITEHSTAEQAQAAARWIRENVMLDVCLASPDVLPLA